MPTYERPIRDLIRDAIADLPETFSSDQMVSWFKERYPLIKPTSVRAHLRFMSVNVIGRHKNHPTLSEYSTFYKVDRSSYAKYDPDRHGRFDLDGHKEGQARDADEDEDLQFEEALTAAESEFALELHLEEFMLRNWDLIDFGRRLQIWEDPEGLRGQQYPTEVGPIDFLCRDVDTGAFVIVELKRGKTSDRVVGQTQRYMGWVRRNLADIDQQVEGLIIASEVSMSLTYAIDVAPNISARRYRVKFELVPPEDTID